MVVGRIVRIEQHRHAADAWSNLLEHAEQFCAEAWLHHREAGDVAAGTGNALHQPVFHGIAGADKDERNGLGELHRRVCGCIAVRQQHIRRKL